MAASGHGKEKAMVCGQAQVWETRPTALLRQTSTSHSGTTIYE